MPSTEAKLLSDFLVAPASLRDFMTQQQFTDIFPKSHRANPAVKELYRELYTLREHDIEVVRQDIAREVKRSTQLKRAYALERRQIDTANVAGLDPTALQMEEQASRKLHTYVHRFQRSAAFQRPRPATAHASNRSRQHRGGLRKPRKPDFRNGAGTARHFA